MSFHKKQLSQNVPVDIGEGRFTTAQLAARHAAREKSHNDLVAGQQSDPLGHKPVDSRSNHETSAGRSNGPTGDSGIVQTKLDPVNAGHTIEYPEAFSNNVWQPGGIVPDSAVKSVSKEGRGDRNLPALANSRK